jgi:hypothetical protein
MPFRSAPCAMRHATINPHSPIRNPQSEIHNPKSTIRNPKSEISPLANWQRTPWPFGHFLRFSKGFYREFNLATYRNYIKFTLLFSLAFLLQTSDNKRKRIAFEGEERDESNG